ncbi:hypothetical protein [Thauera sp.]|uniref:hypothetical protein n=1 Tax=Thauera sp. TaxID=1905334 RepID=UPI0026315D59|nr:hypothetical protein [Thauera sp.]
MQEALATLRFLPYLAGMTLAASVLAGPAVAMREGLKPYPPLSVAFVPTRGQTTRPAVPALEYEVAEARPATRSNFN